MLAGQVVCQDKGQQGPSAGNNAVLGSCDVAARHVVYHRVLVLVGCLGGVWVSVNLWGNLLSNYSTVRVPVSCD